MTSKRDLLERRVSAIVEQLKEAVDVSLLLHSEGDLDRKVIAEIWTAGANDVTSHLRNRSQQMGQNILSWIPLTRLLNIF